MVNAVAAEFGVNQVIFLPDRYLGAWVATQTPVELVLWHGQCEVHEKFTAMEARHTRERFDAKIVAHPECSPEVLAEADFVGSTSAMGKWLEKEKPVRVAMITECSMADNLRNQFPQVEFIKPCNLCPHMKRITLPNIHACLRDMRNEIHVPEDVIVRARKALDRMLAVGRGEKV
jgi:quinolinate synthase